MHWRYSTTVEPLERPKPFHCTAESRLGKKEWILHAVSRFVLPVCFVCFRGVLLEDCLERSLWPNWEEMICSWFPKLPDLANSLAEVQPSLKSLSRGDWVRSLCTGEKLCFLMFSWDLRSSFFSIFLPKSLPISPLLYTKLRVFTLQGHLKEVRYLHGDWEVCALRRSKHLVIAFQESTSCSFSCWIKAISKAEWTTGGLFKGCSTLVGSDLEETFCSFRLRNKFAMSESVKTLVFVLNTQKTLKKTTIGWLSSSPKRSQAFDPPYYLHESERLRWDQDQPVWLTASASAWPGSPCTWCFNANGKKSLTHVALFEQTDKTTRSSRVFTTWVYNVIDPKIQWNHNKIKPA